MNEQEAFLGRLVNELVRLGIPYMIVGSHASSRHGEARSTRDIDIVIEANEAQVRELVGAFQEGFYVSPQAAVDALRQRSMFNVIDLGTGWKCDLIFAKDRPFSAAAFARREPARVLGIQAVVQSPEDAILSKLEWGKASASDLQMRDVVGILRVQRERLDRQYLEHWAKELHVDDLLAAAMHEAE